MGLFNKLSKRTPPIISKADAHLKDAIKKAETVTAERESAKAKVDIAPEELNGQTRSYHYKDVSIIVSWEYGGRYGKTLSDLRLKRGAKLDFVHEFGEKEPESVAVLYNGTKIGEMHENRLRGMVIQWMDAGFPVMAYASSVGGETKLLMELAFYGKPKKRSS